MLGVLGTGVSDEDGALLDGMTAVGSATINGVLVVETPAGRVELNNLIAHLELSWTVSGKAGALIRVGAETLEASTMLVSPGTEQGPWSERRRPGVWTILNSPTLAREVVVQ